MGDFPISRIGWGGTCRNGLAAMFCQASLWTPEIRVPMVGCLVEIRSLIAAGFVSRVTLDDGNAREENLSLRRSGHGKTLPYSHFSRWEA